MAGLLSNSSVRKHAQMRRLAFGARQPDATAEPVKVIALDTEYPRTGEFASSWTRDERIRPCKFTTGKNTT